MPKISPISAVMMPASGIAKKTGIGVLLEM
ncbi:hypothetical protein ACVWXM_007020 [Bradyrhizobium sp. GM7.3]